MNRVVFSLVCLCALSATAMSGSEQADTLIVPAFTAYTEPDSEAVQVSAPGGVTGWSDGGVRLVWYGSLQATGRLGLALSLRLPAGNTSRLRLSVAGRSLTAQVRGADADPVTADFGSVQIRTAGYYRFALEGLEKDGAVFGDLDALQLRGPAADGAQFNLAERRNAASVHLSYPTSADSHVAWFYNEVTVKTDPLSSYYMACGFSRGYFGIQVNSPTERRIIFSVWDSGSEAIDRDRVAQQDRVQLVAKGDGVFAGGFGNEGTGGHSHLVYPWKTGRTYRFLVSAKPEGTATVYSGYFYFPEQRRWGLIASFRAPMDGGYLRGLYSFNEDFDGADGQLRRLAEFGPQWVAGPDHDWKELVTARFSHDETGDKSRKDYGAGAVRDRFYLSNGGFIAGSIKAGDTIHRRASGRTPDVRLTPEQGSGPSLR